MEVPAIDVHDTTLKFAFRTAVPLTGMRSLNLTETAYVDVTFPEAQHFDRVRAGTLWQLQNFLTFATDRKNTVVTVVAKAEDPLESMEVLYQSRFETDSPAMPLRMLFPYSRVSTRLSEVLTRWFDIYDKLGPPLNSMFSVIYGNIRAADTKFLNIVQAAESYHRRMFPLVEEERTRHASRVERILAVAPSEDVDWLTGKLANSGEPFLTERLMSLFDRLGDDFLRPMFRNRKAVRGGAWRIADWRNKLTHMRAAPHEIAQGLFAIHVCTNQLLVTLKANLLLDLGFDRNDLQSLFEYNDTYNYFAHHEE